MTRKGILVLGVLLTLSSTPAHAAYGPGEILLRFRAIEIEESSGLAQSPTDPSILWTHNDSPMGLESVGTFYGVGPDGLTRSTYRVAGSGNVDWEDMAVRTTDAGTSLFFADVGDNSTVRPVVIVYEIAEPVVTPSAQPITITPTAIHSLVYEDGPHNVESFMVDPADGAFVIVTKDADGDSGVYLGEPPAIAGAPRVMRRVADFDVGEIASAQTRSHLETTGGAIAFDRSRIVVRTYVEAFEWELGERTIADAFAGEPIRIELPVTQQGEAIAYTVAGDALLTSTEGQNSPVHRLPLL